MNKWMRSLTALILLATIHTIALADIGFSRLLVDEETQDFLPVEQAFQVLANLQDDAHAQVTFVVAPGHYLYRERIKITLPVGEPGKISEIVLPQGDEKNDPNFGKQQVFHHETAATVTWSGPTPAVLQVRYQGCSEKGLCYPPQTAQLRLTTNQRQTTNQHLTNDTALVNQATDKKRVAEDELSSNLLRNGRWWQIVAGFFGAGLLLAFTPCVFPMIPILSGIIVGKNAQNSRAKAFTLSLAYTLGMSLTYTLAGVAAGLSGQLLSHALQTPTALMAGALVFVLLSLSMFGFYELKLPSSFENLFFNWSNRFKGGHLLGDFLMGAISALIISPCVAAPLAGALLYISQTHDVVLGAVALFSLSLGMGLPLLLIGASAGSILPKAGAWMNAVRAFFGVLMLAVAVWIVNPLLPVSVQMLLWAALCIVPAIVMRAIDPLPVNAQMSQRLLKGLAMILLLYGIALLAGAWSGARSPLQPLQAWSMGPASSNTPSLVFKRIRNITELDAAVQAANGKPVMLDFYADWCVSCKEYAEFVFNAAPVHQRLQQMVLLQVDVTANNADDSALLKRFQLFGPPGIVFFDVHGVQLLPVIKGYQPADRFIEILNQLHTGAAHA